MTYLAPVAPPVPAPSRDPAPAILAVAEALQPDLAQGFDIDALRLRLEMERAFGGSDADGAWDWKLAHEAGEVALILFLRKFGRVLCRACIAPGWQLMDRERRLSRRSGVPWVTSSATAAEGITVARLLPYIT